MFSLITAVLVLGVLAREIRQEKERKSNWVGKKEVKLTLFTNDVIVYIKNPMESTKKLLELVS